MSELVDLYRSDGMRLHLTQERGCVVPHSCYLLHVLALLEDPAGRIVLTRRSPTKRFAAGLWEIPGGAVQAGEDTQHALIRETYEETGITLTKHSLSCIWRWRKMSAGQADNYLVEIWKAPITCSLSDIQLNQDEASEARLVSALELTDLHTQGLLLHGRHILRALRSSTTAVGADLH